MGASRSIPYSVHAAIEMIGGAAILLAPFALGFGAAGAVATVAVGVLLVTVAVQESGPARAIPVAAQAGLEYALAAIAAIAGLVIATATGAWAEGVFLVGVGVAQAALTASTRFSVPIGA